MRGCIGGGEGALRALKLAGSILAAMKYELVLQRCRCGDEGKVKNVLVK